MAASDLDDGGASAAQHREVIRDGGEDYGREGCVEGSIGRRGVGRGIGTSSERGRRSHAVAASADRYVGLRSSPGSGRANGGATVVLIGVRVPPQPWPRRDASAYQALTSWQLAVIAVYPVTADWHRAVVALWVPQGIGEQLLSAAPSLSAVDLLGDAEDWAAPVSALLAAWEPDRYDVCVRCFAPRANGTRSEGKRSSMPGTHTSHVARKCRSRRSYPEFDAAGTSDAPGRPTYVPSRPLRETARPRCRASL